VQPQPARFNLIQRTPAQPAGIGWLALIFQHDFHALCQFGPYRLRQAVAGQNDRLIRLAPVGVANNISHSFVDRPGDRPALTFGKTHSFRQPLHRAPHHIQQFRVTRELKFQQQIRIQCADLSSRLAAQNNVAALCETTTLPNLVTLTMLPPIFLRPAAPPSLEHVARLNLYPRASAGLKLAWLPAKSALKNAALIVLVVQFGADHAENLAIEPTALTDF
jgi:hypothetical protein